MGYKEAFHDIVLKPFRDEYDVRLEMRKHFDAFRQTNKSQSADAFDQYIRREVLKRAQVPCSTRTLALLYAYGYMPCHVDSNKTMIEHEYQTFFEPYIYSKPSNVLMIDVGCGPMTVCVALADYQQSLNPGTRLNLDYVGCDIQPRMTDIASEFGRRRDQNGLFGEHFRECYPDIQNTDWIEKIDCSVKDGGTLVFYFSYFWGQKGVSEAVRKWVDCVKRISLQARADDTFLVYLNIKTEKDNNIYKGFKKQLGEHSGALEIISSEKCNYKYQSLSGMEKWLTQNILPIPLPKESEHLHYEILRVNWRHYEDAGTERNIGV